MTQTFVPFAAMAANADGGSTANAFATGGTVRFTPIASTIPAPAPRPDVVTTASPAHHQPVIKLQCEGDMVKHIQIQCSCGQVIELDCAY